ncbi:uncharacterized protein STEHIDRAFT_158812 [Stereum hirsutum FP-91666 SS1]|uniref:uncharacterized protein n=1 Tax=Stereum hirsutum (strain FP-91666) TaxID=721885 RepID=UPI000444A5CF|nr:uncharacterized protein STEHIDRAFT_158812 [Stereum hirsutum FP-91666 SS1]EIM85118.1 hypothetical protein STEHIDRAFT_158812 [Stereum hirsutum FP-91666 SS1]
MFLRPSIPSDILYLIVEHLAPIGTDGSGVGYADGQEDVGLRDLYNAALANRALNAATTPLLYRTVEGRTRITKTVEDGKQFKRGKVTQVCHPAKSIINRPELAKYVRHVKENGALHSSYPSLTALVLQALSLCKLVHSFTWADDSFGAPTSLPTSLFCSQLLPYSPLSSDSISAHLHHLPTTPPDIGTHHTTGPTFGSNAHGETLFSVLLRAILGRLPWQDQAEHERPGLRSLTLKTYADLGSETWTMLESVASLRKVAIWSMSGPPRVLERWCTTLSPTLTQVELGKCAGVSTGTLLSVFSQLPLLRQLRLKGAVSSAVSLIVAHLPLLELLDTEYISPAQTSSVYADLHGIPPSLLEARTEFPKLRSLTIRTFSISSALSLRPQEEDATTEEHLWFWILSLVPTKSLRGFALNAFSTHGVLWIPRSFVERMTEKTSVIPPSYNDGSFLRSDPVRGCPQIGLEMWEVKGGWMVIEDLELLCARAGALKVVSCAVEIADIADISEAIVPGKNLHTLHLHVRWIPPSPSRSPPPSATQQTFASQVATRYSSPSLSCLSLPNSPMQRFGLADARMLMKRPESSVMLLGIGTQIYTGSWVRREKEDGTNELVWKVAAEVDAMRWC